MHEPEPSLLAVREWISSNLGIHFSDEKLSSLGVRLQSVVHARGLSSVAALVRELQAPQNGARHELAIAVSTNHTFFFREQPTLDFFELEVVQRHDRSRPLRLWSAAAASGEEAYTLAMIVARSRSVLNLEGVAGILGTDISDRALAQAEAAEYEAFTVERIPEALRQLYVSPRANGRGVIIDGLRRACLFRRLNLAVSPWPLRGGFDAVFCRNILYYFEPHTQEAVVNRIYEQVAPGGWLFTSVSETLRELKTKWEPVEPGVYRRPK